MNLLIINERKEHKYQLPIQVIIFRLLNLMI
jgi:hypothetical protein